MQAATWGGHLQIRERAFLGQRSSESQGSRSKDPEGQKGSCHAEPGAGGDSGWGRTDTLSSKARSWDVIRCKAYMLSPNLAAETWKNLRRKLKLKGLRLRRNLWKSNRYFHVQWRKWSNRSRTLNGLSTDVPFPAPFFGTMPRFCYSNHFLRFLKVFLQVSFILLDFICSVRQTME